MPRLSEVSSCGGYDVVEGCDGVSHAWFSHPCRRYVHDSLLYYGTRITFYFLASLND